MPTSPRPDPFAEAKNIFTDLLASLCDENGSWYPYLMVVASLCHLLCACQINHTYIAFCDNSRLFLHEMIDAYNATDCWKGNIDAQNNNRGAFVDGIIAKKKSLQKSITASTDDNEKIALRSQLAGLNEAQAAADFGLYGAAGSYTLDTAAALAFSDLATELDAMLAASAAAAGESASSASLLTSSTTLLIFAGFLSFYCLA